MGAAFLWVVGRWRRAWKHCRRQHWRWGGRQVVCKTFHFHVFAFSLKGFAVGKAADRADALRKVCALSLCLRQGPAVTGALGPPASASRVSEVDMCATTSSGFLSFLYVVKDNELCVRQPGNHKKIIICCRTFLLSKVAYLGRSHFSRTC